MYVVQYMYKSLFLIIKLLLLLFNIPIEQQLNAYSSFNIQNKSFQHDTTE